MCMRSSTRDTVDRKGIWVRPVEDVVFAKRDEATRCLLGY